ncbi:alpha/beta hydrolase [Nocardioides sp. CN2-186]|uniref:alpha/beta hydrolase n=1 Tax=Nocardioides tweenelious TaxID=3156607 RepID=UPI0032B3F555
MTHTEITAWDEPVGGTPRGTVVVLPGRGETPASYARFGGRLSADAYKVRLVPLSLDDVDDAVVAVEKLLADESLPSPKVLLGTDAGATLVATVAESLPVDAAVIAGIVLPESAEVDSWSDEVEARSACPVHRRVIEEDEDFGRGALSQPLPWTSVDLVAPTKPTLVLHGTADVVTPPSVVEPYLGASTARVRLVEGGRHDVLNDLSHRSVAATIVLFLESLRLGSDLPDVVTAAR